MAERTTRTRRAPLSAVPPLDDGPRKVDTAGAIPAKSTTKAAKAPRAAKAAKAAAPARKLSDDVLFALAIGDKLGEFEGSAVIRSGIEIPALGGGLREEVNFLARAFHKGDELYVLARCKVRDIKFKSVKDTECLTRVHVLEPDEVSFVDQAFGERQLAESRKQLRKIRDELVGQGSLDDLDGE